MTPGTAHSARKNYDLVNQSYTLGVASILDLLDAQTQLLDAELTLNDSLDAAILRLYDGSATHAALISDDDFIVSRDGKSVVLIGGMDDFFGSQQDLDDILQGFSGLGSSLEQFLNQNGN